ncbi:metal ABC transporter substrate-binding protein [uncultured Nocardioides sp.]|mgnify:FL=1|uniref:metal ABC transporter substrate-binding protein n=1 Tax=uncultured Nocardioides sp. TaxID=198441 RepID=UPI00262F402B|nr:metal ABC transporter substrate-binding protein [uncultured Nocardioides sp.]
MHFSPTRLTTPLAAAALGAMALTGCGTDSEEAAADGTLQVAAAFYPLEFVASRVGGDRVEVTTLTGPGTEPHDVELTVAQTALVGEADLVLYQDSMQPIVGDAVEQTADGATLEVEEVIDFIPFAEEHDHAEDEHAEDEHAEEEEEEEEEHDHDHGDEDPHFWLDPARMATVAEAVASELGDIDPDHAEEYDANAAALVEELDELDAAYSEGLANCERDVVVVSHDAFGYLGDRYGLDIHGIAGLSPDAEPGPADIAELQELIDAEGVTTVFSETLVSPATAETLAQDAGVGTDVLDPLEGLSDETADEDYLSIMRSNLASLQEANGCQ